MKKLFLFISLLTFTTFGFSQINQLQDPGNQEGGGGASTSLYYEVKDLKCNYGYVDYSDGIIKMQIRYSTYNGIKKVTVFNVTPYVMPIGSISINYKRCFFSGNILKIEIGATIVDRVYNFTDTTKAKIFLKENENYRFNRSYDCCTQ